MLRKKHRQQIESQRIVIEIYKAIIKEQEKQLSGLQGHCIFLAVGLGVLYAILIFKGTTNGKE